MASRCFQRLTPATTAIRLEYGAGKARRGDAAKIALTIGRRHIVDVERTKFRDRPFLRKQESAAGPEAVPWMTALHSSRRSIWCRKAAGRIQFVKTGDPPPSDQVEPQRPPGSDDEDDAGDI
jgi:hypothetical protein